MVWKEIPGFAGYEVSEHGDVRLGLKQLKAERVHGSGRKRFGLNKNGRLIRFHAAHLVAFAFIGPKPFKKAMVCHNDGFEHNNHYSNLRWDNHLSNVADAQKHRLRIFKSLGRATEAQRLSAEATSFLARHHG